MNEKLYEELVMECDRLTEIIDNSDEGSDEWTKALNKKLDILDKMNAFYKTASESEAKAKDREVAKLKDDYMFKLEQDKLVEHRVIEELRSSAQIELENKKQEVTWKRVAFEMIKLLIPLGVTIWHYNQAQKRVFDFEEHGRITSSAGRELHLPKIWSK